MNSRQPGHEDGLRRLATTSKAAPRTRRSVWVRCGIAERRPPAERAAHLRCERRTAVLIRPLPLGVPSQAAVAVPAGCACPWPASAACLRRLGPSAPIGELLSPE